MANAFYGKGRQAFAEGSIAWNSDNIKAVLVDTGSYSLVINSDQFLSDITGGARVATSGNFSSKSTTLGVLDAADVTFTAVSGNQCSLLVIYKDTGTASTSPLLMAIDTGTGLPITPNGGDITVAWDNGSNKIAKLFEALGELEKRTWRDRLAAWWRKTWRGAEVQIPQPAFIMHAPAR